MLPQIKQENFLQQDGRFWMTADVLAKKLGFSDNSSGVRNILSKNQEELEPFKGYHKLRHPLGGEQTFLAFDEQGCYIIAMLARTEQAKLFRRALAQFLKSMREQQLSFLF